MRRLETGEEEEEKKTKLRGSVKIKFTHRRGSSARWFNGFLNSWGVSVLVCGFITSDLWAKVPRTIAEMARLIAPRTTTYICILSCIGHIVYFLQLIQHTQHRHSSNHRFSGIMNLRDARRTHTHTCAHMRSWCNLPYCLLYY